MREDMAEVICLGCGGMAGLDAAVRAATGVPVVDGVAAAVKLAESGRGWPPRHVAVRARRPSPRLPSGPCADGDSPRREGAAHTMY